MAFEKLIGNMVSFRLVHGQQALVEVGLRSKLGFVVRNPYLKPEVFEKAATGGDFLFVSIEKQQP